MSEDSKKSLLKILLGGRVSDQKKGPSLVQYSGKKLGRRFNWIGDTVTIGSNDGCDFKIDEDSLSPVHCILTKKPEDYFIIDLNSTKGTFIGDLRVVDKQQIHEGDILLLGEVYIKFFAV
ncbi:MAG: FHA domain-containing protein [Proteobacteria bacterium]|nr:FHA domain-containing protein [Pseudomonadota bacterium]